MDFEQNRPPARGVIPVSEMIGDTEEETALLHDLYDKAVEYISSFAWCRSIQKVYFGDGVGKVIGIFLVHLAPASAEVDDWLWVIVGDLPPAYLVLDEAKTPAEGLERYIECMSEWVTLAYVGQTSADVIPVNGPPTPDSAKLLDGRLKVLKEEFLPWFSNGKPQVTR